VRQPERDCRRISVRGSTGVADTVCLYQPGPIALDVLAAIVDELG
jgi:hypothetical protein